MIETADDLADPNNAAAAYMKLQEDVKALILETVRMELMNNPHGLLGTQIRHMALTSIQNDARAILDREIQSYRIVYRGTTAAY